MNYARTEEHASPNADLWHGKGKYLLQRICGRGVLPFSGQGQVDAAAKLDEDEVRCGDGGEAPVTDGGERKKMRNGKNEEDLVGSIYKEGPLKEREKRGGRKYELSNYKVASIFGMAIKTKVRCYALDKTFFYDM